MTINYTIKSLTELAEYFETLASDQIAARRWQLSERAKRDCNLRAEVWRDAAAVVRMTQIETQTEPTP